MAEIFQFSTVVSSYNIEENSNLKFIVGLNTETKIKKTNESDESLCIQFANLNISNKRSIINFCNNYGLPFSSYKCEQLRAENNIEINSAKQEKVNNGIVFNYLDLLCQQKHINNITLLEILEGSSNNKRSKNHSREGNAQSPNTNIQLYSQKHDYMLLDFFTRLVKIVKSILMIADYIQKGEKVVSLNLAVFYLSYLLFFYKKGCSYLDLNEPSSYTGKFCLYLQNYLHSFQCNTIVKNDDEISYLKDLYKDLYKYDISALLNGLKDIYKIKNSPLYNNEDTKLLVNFISSFPQEYYYKLLDFDFSSKNLYKITKNIEKFQIDNTFQYFSKDFAKKVITDLINDEILNINRKIVTENNNFVESIEATYLMEYIYADLYNQLVNRDSFKKCEYLYCNNFFIKKLHYKNKRFCCENCRKKASRLNNKK